MIFLVERNLGKLLWGVEKKTRAKIRKGVRIDVWDKYIGKEKAEGRCYVCRKPIRITGFEVGHNKAIAKGGSDRISNLRPICRKCNSSMGTMSIEAYKRKYYSNGRPAKKIRKSKKRKGTKRGKPKTEMERLGEQMGKELQKGIW